MFFAVAVYLRGFFEFEIGHFARLILNFCLILI